MVRKFTNRPSTAASDPSWEYRPENLPPPGRADQPDFIGGGLMGDQKVELDGVTPGDLGELRGHMESARAFDAGGGSARPGAISPPGAQPSPEATVSDYSHEERERFINQIIDDEFGGQDPRRTNIYDQYAQIEKSQLPGLFRNFFGGQVRYEDLGMIDQKYQKEWNQEHAKFKAFAMDKLEYEQGQNQDLLDQMTEQWDAKAKEHKTKREAFLKEQETKRKEARKAPELKKMINAKGDESWHKWDPDKKAWTDTGKRSKAAKSAAPKDLASLAKWQDELIYGLGGTQMPKSTLNALNKWRDSLGMAPMVENEVKPGSPGFGGGAFPFGIGDPTDPTYEYTEETKAPEVKATEKAAPKTPANFITAKTMQDPMPDDIKAGYPGAFWSTQGPDGSIVATVEQDGKLFAVSRGAETPKEEGPKGATKPAGGKMGRPEPKMKEAPIKEKPVTPEEGVPEKPALQTIDKPRKPMTRTPVNVTKRKMFDAVGKASKKAEGKDKEIYSAIMRRFNQQADGGKLTITKEIADDWVNKFGDKIWNVLEHLGLPEDVLKDMGMPEGGPIRGKIAGPAKVRKPIPKRSEKSAIKPTDSKFSINY